MLATVTVDHADKEFYNAVWRSVKLRRVLTLDDALQVLKLYREYREKNMIVEPESAYLDAAFELAVASGVTVYDALYIALALHHGIPLLTLDERAEESRAAARRMGSALEANQGARSRVRRTGL